MPGNPAHGSVQPPAPGPNCPGCVCAWPCAAQGVRRERSVLGMCREGMEAGGDGSVCKLGRGAVVTEGEEQPLKWKEGNIAVQGGEWSTESTGVLMG